MKKIILLLSFTLLITTTFAQFSEMNKAIIAFKDGSTKKGFALFKYSKIKFKVNKKAKKQMFDHKTVDFIQLWDIHVNDFIKYYYKKVTAFNNYHLLKLHKKGNISIYLTHSVYVYSDEPPPRSRFFIGIGGINIPITPRKPNKPIVIKTTPLHNNNYYLCKNNTESVIFFSNRDKKFKTEATAYFKDCPSLVTKINDGEFTKNHIAEMVDYYNTKCEE